jgi:signal transduction histidine kinase
LGGSTPTLGLGRAQLVTLVDSRFELATTQGPLEGFATHVEVGGRKLLGATAGNAPGALWYLGARLQRVVLFVLPLIAAALVVVAWQLRRGIRPLAALARDAASIDLDTGSRRLEIATVPSELLPLVDAFNTGLERLTSTFAARRRVLHDAAHRLRMPLAVLRACVDAMPARGARPPVARRAPAWGHGGPAPGLRAGGAPLPVPVDLAALAAGLVADYAPLAHTLGIEVAFLADSAPARVMGHPRAFAAGLANVLDNALRVKPRGAASRFAWSAALGRWSWTTGPAWTRGCESASLSRSGAAARSARAQASG